MSKHSKKDSTPIEDEESVAGPELPPGFHVDNDQDESHITPSKPEPSTRRVIGPVPPGQNPTPESAEEEEEDDDGPIVGPRPVSSEEAEEIEARNQKNLKEWEKEEWNRIREGRSQASSKATVREDWMVSLPEGKSAISALAGPRQFSKKGVGKSQVDSSWTKSPLDNTATPKVVVNTKAMLEEDLQREKDKQTQQLIEEHKKLRGPSLVELHQQQNKRKDDGNFPRSFDRDRDVNRSYVDSGKRQKMISGAKNLDSNFTKGSGIG